MPKYANMTTLSRREIKSFDMDARQLVEDFHAAGWRSYLSKNGHAILHAPDGKSTASVSGHSDGPHKSKAARADLERWLRQNDNGRPEMSREQRRKSKYGRGNAFRKRRSFENHPKPEQHHEPEHDNRVQESHMAKLFGCPDCPEREPFKSQGAYNLHRQRVHEGMVCPECGEAFHGGGNATRYREHRRIKHGVIPRDRKSGRAPDGEYPCQFPGCPEVFTSKLGRGGHMKKHKNPRNNIPRPAKVVTPTDVFSHAAPARPKAAPAPKAAAPAPAPKAAPVEQQQATRTLVATGTSTDLDQWLQGQNPADLLASVFAVLAPPLVGEIERLRRQRDELTEHVEGLRREAENREAHVQELRTEAENYETKMAILREAMGL